MNETMFFNDGQVAVSNARFMVFGKTYAMNAVVSVGHWTQSPSAVMPILLIVAGVISLLGALSAKSWFAALIGGLFLVPGILWASKQKPTHIVVPSTSSGELQALASKDYP